jgi:O-antigen/teichoic acid export membrane protein
MTFEALGMRMPLRRMQARGAASPLIRPLYYSFGASAAIQFCNVVTGVLLARALGPSLRGELAAVVVWFTFLATVSTLGLTDAITYFCAQGAIAATRTIGTALALLVPLAVCGMAAGGALLAMGLGSSELASSRSIILLYVPLGLVTAFFMAALNGIHSYGAFQLVRVLEVAITILLLGVLAGTHKLTVSTALGAYVCASLGTALVTAVLVRARLREKFSATRSLAPRLLSYGVRGHPSNVIPLLSDSVDQMLIAVLLVPRSLGLYVVALSLASAGRLVGQSAAIVALPVVARDRLRASQGHIARRLTGLVAVTSTFVSLPLAVVTPFLLSTLFGGQFASVADVTRLLMVTAIVIGCARVLGSSIKGMGQPLEVALGEGVGLFVKVAAFAVLLPLMGLYGAALGGLVGAVATFIWLFRLVRRDRTDVDSDARRVPAWEAP